MIQKPLQNMAGLAFFLKGLSYKKSQGFVGGKCMVVNTIRAKALKILSEFWAMCISKL